MKTSVLLVSNTHAVAEVNNLCVDNDEDEGAGGADSVTVIDIVDAHRLKEIELDKKGFGAYLKGIKYWFFLLFCNRIRKES